MSTLGRPPIGTGSRQSGTSLEAVDEGMRFVGTAACLGALLPSTSGRLLRGPWSATATAGRMGAGPRTRGARTMVTLRWPRGRTGASPRTLTSARSSGMPPAMVAAPRRPRAARWPRPMTIGRRSARRIGKARPATGTDDCSAATTPGSPTLLPAPRASCGVSSGTPGSPAGTSPPTPNPSAVMCAASTSRTWMSAGGDRAGCPVDSLRPAPSCGECALTAFAPATRTGRTISSSAGTCWSGPGATACLARRAGTCTTRRAGCT